MHRPSLLFLNRVYPPAEGATGQLLAELAQELVRRGHVVTVVTSRSGANDSRSEIVAGVRVERVGGLPFTRASHWRRALSYLSLYPALLWRALRLPRHDVVVTLTDPPLQLVLGEVIRRCRKSKAVHWAQDIYPELAEEMGVLERDGWIARRLRNISTAVLRRCSAIVAVGECMKRRLVQRGLPGSSIAVIPNWGHGNAECGISNVEWGTKKAVAGTSRSVPGEAFRKEHGLAGKFVVMYSGNLGLAHPFESMLDAAERLQSTLPSVVFLFVGSGPRLPWVKQQVDQRQLRNVRFLPFQPRECLAESLAAADLHLASMRHELSGLVVPSKVYGVLAAGRPCVFLGPEDSEAAQVILQHGCGSVLSHATGARLASILTHWATHPEGLAAAQSRVEGLHRLVTLPTAVQAFEAVLRRAVDLNRTPAWQALALPSGSTRAS